MAQERIWLHFTDEGYPQITSGLRLVQARVGYKWVYLREVHLSDRGIKRTKRITRARFDELRAKTERAKR